MINWKALELGTYCLCLTFNVIWWTALYWGTKQGE